MSKNSIDSSTKNHEKISDKLEQISFNSVRKALPDNAIVRACKAVDYNYRERKITPIVTVLHVIMAAIWPEDSFNASWQVLWASLVSRFTDLKGQSPSRGKVSQARARLPLGLWRFLFEWICKKVQELSQAFDKWKGHRVVLLDGTCVSMSDNPELFKEFGKPTGYHGKCKYPLARLVTSLLDNKLYPADEIAALYGKRWRIETLFKEVKINLSADVLRSLSPDGIRKEVTARLISVNIVRMIMLEAAIDNDVDPIRISFVYVVRAIVMFAPALATEPIWKLPQIYKAMLAEIAAHLVPERLGRNEPRAVTRERKHYPKLKTTRKVWRNSYAA